MLASKIVAAVLDKGTIEVNAMVRSSNEIHQEKHQKIDEVKANGTGIVEGDLMKAETLRRACPEVDVIVSIVGHNKVTVLGQKNLIDAAKQQGVKHFIPSDYSVDYCQLSLGGQQQPGYAKGRVCVSVCGSCSGSLGLYTQAMKTKSPTSLRSWGF